MYPASSWRIALRALDDDPHASVLINRSVTKDTFSPLGFPTRRWTVLSSPSLLKCQIRDDVKRLGRLHSRRSPHKRHAGSTDCLRFSFIGGKRKKIAKIPLPRVSRIWTKPEVQINPL